MLKNAEGFKVLEVRQGALNYKDTKVQLSMGSQSGWVSYEDPLPAERKKLDFAAALRVRKGQINHSNSFKSNPQLEMFKEALMKKDKRNQDAKPPSDKNLMRRLLTPAK